jgi:PPOX class probable F420-dependent enzyme
MAVDPASLEKVASRLEKEQNIWLSTIRADCRPHLVPIWFVWHAGRVWISTPRGTQKHVNILRNPQVCVALEDGNSPVIFEGTAQEDNDPATRAALNPVFISKYDWDMVNDRDADYLLIAITPTKMLTW